MCGGIAGRGCSVGLATHRTTIAGPDNVHFDYLEFPEDASYSRPKKPQAAEAAEAPKKPEAAEDDAEAPKKPRAAEAAEAPKKPRAAEAAEGGGFMFRGSDVRVSVLPAQMLEERIHILTHKRLPGGEVRGGAQIRILAILTLARLHERVAHVRASVPYARAHILAALERRSAPPAAPPSGGGAAEWFLGPLSLPTTRSYNEYAASCGKLCYSK